MCTCTATPPAQPAAHVALHVTHISTVDAARRHGRKLSHRALAQARREAEEAMTLIKRYRIRATKEELALIESMLGRKAA